ncbi:hypothetical protein LCGC14_0438850 [marine sediment metagenome]|uniref:Uncharacterized protein n=1 Tax=marine sediment metagenome TaxID=412755 RepID=A0A0F9T3V2_9ZZZZ
MGKDKKDFKKISDPKFREMSFAGNMPSQYEKDLKKAIAKKSKSKRK